MKQKTGICEYEELIKAKMFFMEGQREFHDFTFEKIKRGLSSEYLGNINEKIERYEKNADIVDEVVRAQFVQAVFVPGREHPEHVFQAHRDGRMLQRLHRGHRDNRGFNGESGHLKFG